MCSFGHRDHNWPDHWLPIKWLNKLVTFPTQLSFCFLLPQSPQRLQAVWLCFGPSYGELTLRANFPHQNRIYSNTCPVLLSSTEDYRAPALWDLHVWQSQVINRTDRSFRGFLHLVQTFVGTAHWFRLLVCYPVYHSYNISNSYFARSFGL